MNSITIINHIFDFFFPSPPEVALLETMSFTEAQHTLPTCAPFSTHSSAIFMYRHPLVQTLIWQLKYTGNKKIARLCGEIMYHTIRKQIHTLEEKRTPFEIIETVVLIPVPLSKRRRRERGFNQNERVIEEIMRCAEKNKDSRLDYTSHALVKIKDTAPQSSLKRKSERLYNVCDCFDVPNNAMIRGKIIFLIDDIVTTGSTFKECKKMLLSAGASYVHCIAIAH